MNYLQNIYKFQIKINKIKKWLNLIIKLISKNNNIILKNSLKSYKKKF
jgi:hypothetical protein